MLQNWLRIHRKLIVLCVLSIALNIFFSQSSVAGFLRFPLYADTIFNAVIVFSAGLIPALIVAFFSWLFPYIYYGGLSLFILCSIAEVFLIWFLNPNKQKKTDIPHIIVLVKLILIYVLCVIAVSVLGGIINYVSVEFSDLHLLYIPNPMDNFKLSLIIYDLPKLAVNILSRIPVNIVDRFLVVFGGYGIALVVKKLNI
jgi:hypothetical protein